MKLSYRDRSERVRSVIKTRQDNDVTNRIGLVYVENNTKLSQPIELGAVHDETR